MSDLQPSIRLFLGARIPKEMHSGIKTLQDYLAPAPWLRWTSPDNLHLTTFFLGQVPREILTNLVELFALGCRDQPPVHLHGGQWVWAPPGQVPRMLWLRFRKAPAFTRLVRRQQELYQQVLPMPQQRRAPIPHVTLARFSEANKAEAIMMDDLPPAPDALDIRQVYLWKSDFDPDYPKAPTYTEIARYELLGTKK